LLFSIFPPSDDHSSLGQKPQSDRLSRSPAEKEVVIWERHPRSSNLERPFFAMDHINRVEMQSQAFYEVSSERAFIFENSIFHNAYAFADFRNLLAEDTLEASHRAFNLAVCASYQQNSQRVKNEHQGKI
jgi:hypothetical protein